MNKERHIYIGIIIFLIATLATTLVLFTQFNNETWHEVATTFIFPFINAIVGAIIVTVVGTIIANKVLENYNERLSYGLSKRVIQLLGYPEFSDRIREDLKYSALMKNEILPVQSTVSRRADLVILSLDLDWYNGRREELEKTTADKLNRAEQKLTQTINDLDDSQALIVLTVGRLDDSAPITENLKKRRFSTIVNAQGRVLSDIHSLLTTLPPRNGE
ncbi:hypothetical protein HMPREF1138_0834 [Actinomyces sp. ICM58]|uniref:hypothetical protein n=1 Tax=Actinomyces sp. ICM58 TaxID=1105030 RepID=UPI000277181F|nr:hypothetical protein [Actinomyces sp. ICM58]EJN53116.1 hypothetical protein HMPREF1138_0834 [Actinomyces sp. ICM58]